MWVVDEATEAAVVRRELIGALGLQIGFWVYFARYFIIRSPKIVLILILVAEFISPKKCTLSVL